MTTFARMISFLSSSPRLRRLSASRRASCASCALFRIFSTRFSALLLCSCLIGSCVGSFIHSSILDARRFFDPLSFFVSDSSFESSIEERRFLVSESSFESSLDARRFLDPDSFFEFSKAKVKINHFHIVGVHISRNEVKSPPSS